MAPWDAREQRRVDLNSEEWGVPVERLMANAGKALARELARHAAQGKEVLLLCGKGIAEARAALVATKGDLAEAILRLS